MGYDSRKFANYIVHYFISIGDPITNKKLQKLMYYIQSWYLVYFKKKNIFNEIPQAWVHGPVFPSVYKEYKLNGDCPIIFDNKEISYKEVDDLFNKFSFNKEQSEFLKSVINHYGTKTGLELELLSHNEEPWIEARGNCKPFERSENKINLTTAYNYYKSLLPN